MEITGKIIAALEPRGGTSARTGNAWKTQEFVIETFEQFPKRCVFNIFGEDKLNQFNIQVGETMTISFDINAREWNGRWFNDIRAWNVQRVDEAAARANGGAPAPAPAPMATAAPFPPADNAAPFPPAQPAAPASPAAPAEPASDSPMEDLPF